MRTVFVAIALVLFAKLAFAAPSEFSTEGYRQLQESGSPYVVGFHAWWCGTCRVQKPALEALLRTDEFAGVAGLMADFHTHSDTRKALKVTSPSTLVLMKGTQVIARSVGVTDKNELAAFLRRTKSL